MCGINLFSVTYISKAKTKFKNNLFKKKLKELIYLLIFVNERKSENKQQLKKMLPSNQTDTIN